MANFIIVRNSMKQCWWLTCTTQMTKAILANFITVRYRVSNRFSDTIHSILVLKLVDGSVYGVYTLFDENVEVRCKPYTRRPSSFGDTTSNIWGSETSFVGTWPITSDSCTSATRTAEWSLQWAATHPCELGHLPTYYTWSFYSQVFIAGRPEKRHFGR